MKIAPFGRYRASDADGKPLSGGKLYTYEAGTSTPKKTYVDKNGTAENQNPVRLDANGYADVWLDTSAYKFILKDANDVTQWTVDNIDGGGAEGYASAVISKSQGFTLSTNEQNTVIVATAAISIGLISAATAGDGFAAIIINMSSGNVTIDPDGSETINSAETMIIPAGGSATIHTNGVAWYASGYVNVTQAGNNTFTGANTFNGATTYAGSMTVNGSVLGNLNAAESLSLSGAVTPAALTAATNNWAPTDATSTNTIAKATIIRAQASSVVTITGLTLATPGKLITIENIGTVSFILAHENTGSTAANRFRLPANASLTVGAGESVTFVYDNTTTRWQALAQAIRGVVTPRAHGLVIKSSTTAPNNTLTVSCTDAVLIDTGFGAVRHTAVSLSMVATTVGANGIDAESLAASTWYYLWLISNGTTVATLLSLSSTAPTLPTGYTYRKRIGACVTNASSAIRRMVQRGVYAEYVPLDGDSSPTYPNIGYTGTLSLTAVIPPTAEMVKFLGLPNGGANSQISIAQAGGTNSNLLVEGGSWSGLGFRAAPNLWVVPNDLTQMQATYGYTVPPGWYVQGWMDSV